MLSYNTVSWRKVQITNTLHNTKWVMGPIRPTRVAQSVEYPYPIVDVPYSDIILASLYGFPHLIHTGPLTISCKQ